ncbi:MAG TPA: DNA integrity scanning protein DisA nucleotide-binding domain protein [Anaerovoracaceae bacterium]|nr:DNA integrity scanning protein DisA nucleotide-binding domain protein [Anaerovoracaceae bacterium]
MSSNNKGTIIVITTNDIPECRSSMLPSRNFEKQKISEIPKDQIINYSLLDGAIVINSNGELIGIAQKLEAPFSEDCVLESGRGTKHNSASMYSGAVDCLVFVVSHEGPITLYYKGRIFNRCFGEIFGY